MSQTAGVSARAPAAFYLHPAASLHDTGWGHPEHQGRLRALASTVGRDLLALHGRVEQRDASRCSMESLERVHEVGMLAYLQRQVARAADGNEVLTLSDGETRVSGASWEAATGSVGAILDACERVARGESSTAFVAARPPGHHATPNRAMGFCLLNGVAVAARHLQESGLAGRVLIVDWDVHHGNGTQEIFYQDPSVFYLSIHQAGMWPGTGEEKETGSGRGQGTTMNIQVPSGFPGRDYLARFHEALQEAERRFHPEFILISAGLDALKGDPLGGQMLQHEDFHAMTEEVLDVARRRCNGKVVAVLEGGYDPQGTGMAAVNVIRALAGVDPARPGLGRNEER
ncbi:MAG: histone deacetylase [Gemmatimonadota bacterium]